MPISDEQFAAWLSEDHADRVVLYEQDYIAEVDGGPVQGTLYLSDRGYMPRQVGRASTDTTPYDERITAVPEFTRSLSGNRLNTYSSSIGAVELVNTDGDLDFMLDLAIDGSEARFYLGGADWQREDFRLIFTALGLCVRRAPFRRLTVDLKDSSALLNKSIGGLQLVGGTGPHAEQAKPVPFGLVRNMTPLIQDELTLRYVHADDANVSGLPIAQGISLEVRDDGVPVHFVDNGDGTFDLAATPAGLITCDVDAVWDVDMRLVSHAMEQLVGQRAGLVSLGLYAGPHPTFVPEDVDDYPIGNLILESRNVIDLLGELTDSGNCFTAIRRDGLFTFGRLKPYDIDSFGLTPVRILEDDIVPSAALELEHLPAEYYRFQAYAHKNWTQQSALSDLLDPEEKARFTRRGLYALQATVGGTSYVDAPELYHKTLTTSPPIETLLSWDDESSILHLTQWMETRRAMTLPWTEIVTVTLPLGANPDDPAMFYELELGDVVELVVPRFDFDDGELFQVISVSINLTKMRVQLRLLRKRGATAPPVGWESAQTYIIASLLNLVTGPPTIEVVPVGPPIGVPPIVVVGPPSAPPSPPPPPPPPPPPTDTYLWLDFFDEPLADLSTHSPDIGSAYTNDGTYTDRADLDLEDMVGTFPGRMVAGVGILATEDAHALEPLTTPPDDYWLEARIWWAPPPEGATEDSIFVYARKSGSTLYRLTLTLATGGSLGSETASLLLQRIVSGTPTTVASASGVPLANGIAHVLRWGLNGADIKVYVDGTNYIDIDDTGGIEDSGDEVGIGIEHDPTSGTYFDVVAIDSAACAGHDAGPEFQLYETSLSMSLGAESGGERLLSCPSTGTFTFELHLIGYDPAASWGMGYIGTIPTGLTLGNPAADANDVPILQGTFTADDVSDVFMFQLQKDSVAFGPFITLNLV